MIILKPKKSFLLWLMDKEGTQVVLLVGNSQNSQEDFQSLGRRLDEADALGAFAKL